MKTRAMLFAGAVCVAMVQHGPARAWWYEPDRSWPLFAFHEYDGSDVNRPGDTPDRPYWHGDDAVPLGMRWQDLEAARAQADAEAAATAAAAAPLRVPHARVRTARRPHLAIHRSPRICVPARAAIPLAAR